MQLYLPYREWRRLYRRAYYAQQRNQDEVAGLFSSDSDGKLSLEFLRNVSDRPGHYELRLEDIADARRSIRQAGKRLIGVFHSHPIGYAVPGPRDIETACINQPLLIYDVCGVTARLWRIIRRGRQRAAVELPLKIERSPRMRANRSG